MIEYAFKSIQRKPLRSILICAVLVLVFISELTGVYLYAVAAQGEDDAFRYNGPAIYVLSESQVMTEDTYKKIMDIPGVVGTNAWMEALAETKELTISTEHTGAVPIPAQTSSNWNKKTFPLLALMDTSLDSWFYYEKSVSLTSGEYPSADNGGILIESRLAQDNDLSVGDEIEFTISGDDYSKLCTLPICGIFTADTDFIISDTNTSGEKVYVYSPYNRIFIDYATLAGIAGSPKYPPYGCQVYVDARENVDSVAVALRALLGDNAEISDNTVNIERTASAVAIMRRFSMLITGGAFILGSIVLLILFALYAKQYRYESGIYLALGGSKGFVLRQFFLSMLALVLVALLLANIIFTFSAGAIMQQADHLVTAISPTVDYGVGPYSYSNLNLGFSLNMDAAELAGSEGLIIVAAAAILILLITMLIPAYSVYKTRAKELLRVG